MNIFAAIRKHSVYAFVIKVRVTRIGVIPSEARTLLFAGSEGKAGSSLRSE
jgi:hypothetical protein